MVIVGLIALHWSLEKSTSSTKIHEQNPQSWHNEITLHLTYLQLSCSCCYWRKDGGYLATTKVNWSAFRVGAYQIQGRVKIKERVLNQKIKIPARHVRPRPVQPYNFQANEILWDGPFIKPVLAGYFIMHPHCRCFSWGLLQLFLSLRPSSQLSEIFRIKIKFQPLSKNIVAFYSSQNKNFL